MIANIVIWTMRHYRRISFLFYLFLETKMPETNNFSNVYIKLIPSFILVFISFYINYDFTMWQSTKSPYLYDSGWFAYLFGSGDIILSDPKSVDGFSYYNYHVSPYLSLISILSHALSLNGVVAFSLHQGAIGALIAFCIISFSKRSGSSILFLAACIFILFANPLLQITSYPHFESAIVGLSLLSMLLATGTIPTLAIFPAAILCLVREDGGLYAAAAIGFCTIVSHNPRYIANNFYRTTGFWIASFCALYSVFCFYIKKIFFVHSDPFRFNFSGWGWDHINILFVSQRIYNIIHNPEIFISITSMMVLCYYSVTYLFLFIILSPLLFIYGIAYKDTIGNFDLYYDIPWVMVLCSFFVISSMRGRNHNLNSREAMVLLAASVLVSCFSLSSMQFGTSKYVISRVLHFNISYHLPERLQHEVSIMAARYPDICTSEGIAALSPNSISASQLVDDISDFSQCKHIAIFNGDMWYSKMQEHAYKQGFKIEKTLQDKIEIYYR